LQERCCLVVGKSNPLTPALPAGEGERSAAGRQIERALEVREPDCGATSLVMSSTGFHIAP